MFKSRAGKNNANYRHGKCLIRNHCIDCNKLLGLNSGYYDIHKCRSCAQKGKIKTDEAKNKLSKLNKGKKNKNYKDGRSMLEHYYCFTCKDEITRQTANYGTGLCKSCNAKEVYARGECSLPEDMSGPNHPNWRGGLSVYPSEFNERLKTQIKKHDDYKCQYCGITEEEHILVNSRVLAIHHINYDKQNCKESNLITLCQQCNLRANYNRDYWQELYTNKIEVKD